MWMTVWKCRWINALSGDNNSGSVDDQQVKKESRKDAHFPLVLVAGAQ
jgi:hypothetical protein